MSLIKSILILLVLILSFALSVVLKPNKKIVDSSLMPNFEDMIPREFGSWKVDTKLPMILGDPAMEGKLNAIYSQNLSRTYVNESGVRIMLSIAYGVDQSDSMQVHKPEVCYPAQGFVINSIAKGLLNVANKQIPVTYLDTAMNSRREFVTYWILVGDEVVDGGMQRKLKQLEYGLQGIVADGLLFRVSSLGSAGEEEFLYQKEYIHSLLSSMGSNDRSMLIGKN